MTPYVVNEDDSEANLAQKPKSIMVNTPNGAVNGGLNGTHNGDAVKTNGDLVETPDSIPSRSSVSGRSIIGNGKNGKSGALKRVSFGSSKGSMVETLVYDHLDDLSELSPFVTPPLLNGEDSRLHPAKVRVKFFESQQVAQVACTPPSPDVTLDFGSDAMTSPVSDQSPNYARQMSVESGVDNPFRPDGELSREADTIVSLIKEGKPITPVKGGEEDFVVEVEDQMESVVVSNGLKAQDAMDNVVASSPISVSKIGANGSTPKESSAKNSMAAPGVLDVQRGVIAPPGDTPQVEQVVIKKKPKCKCCIVQ